MRTKRARKLCCLIVTIVYSACNSSSRVAALSCPDPSSTNIRKIIDDPLLTEIHSDDYSDGLPSTFAYPHWYEPHPVAKWAADRLREEILQNPPVIDNNGNSGDEPERPVGKMFGVLVVTSSEGKLGYYKGYSGTLPQETTSPPDGFVPLVYNRMDPLEFYKRGETELNKINRNVLELELDPRRAECSAHVKAVEDRHYKEFAEERIQQKARKVERDRKRSEVASTLDDGSDTFRTMMDMLVQESNADQRRRKALKNQSRDEIAEVRRSMDKIDGQIEHLKNLRQEVSALLQEKLFNSYKFLNILGETESLLPIFSQTPLRRPPAGAGDCAAIKLLQHAFLMGHRPIAMAEFWWGLPPNLELRKHNLYYPACRGKCEPILAHMLRGLEVQPNPLDQIPKEKPELEIIYEDDCMVVINKPHGMLSVPGRRMEHSIYTEMKQRYPSSSGPLLVHRLDMSTSGILLVAKDKDTHKKLSAQFIDRSVKKRYTALLEGKLCHSISSKGRIDLPLASDYLNRPMQKVDMINGKPAVTFYEVVNDDREAPGGLNNGRTRVRFYPVVSTTN